MDKARENHITHDALMSYLDGELPAQAQQFAEAHLQECQACRMAADNLRKQQAVIAQALGSTAPQGSEQPDRRRALMRLQQTVHIKDDRTMLNWFKNNRQARQIAAGIAAVAIIVGLFSIGPVRALASDFLGLFRVESFVAVDIDPERMAEVAEALDGGLLIGDMEMINEPAEPEMVASVAEASARVGFTPRTLSGYGDPTIVLVSDDMQVRFTPDLETMRMLFDTLEISTDALPSEADGKPFEVVVPGGVVFMYSDGDPDMSKDVVLTQVPSPTVDTPDDVDVRDLSIAALQVMGLSRPEAERLSQSIDLTTTLVLPIPSAFASVEEVRVDGTRGLLVNSLEGAGSILLWQKDGIVMVIMADSGSVDLVDIAEQLD